MRTIADGWIEEGFHKGMDKGLDLGRQEGVRQALAEVLVEDLELRFGGVPEPLAERIHSIRELDALKGLRRKLREAASIEEYERVVASETPH